MHVYSDGRLRNYVLLIQHHVSGDGYSAGLLFSEWQQLYSASIQGDTIKVAPAGDYVDSLRSQQNWLAGSEAERQLSYWRQQLSGELPRLQLPIDCRHPPRCRPLKATPLA